MDSLTKRNAEDLNTLTTELTDKCNAEKATFKQSFIEKYNEDLAKFTEEINKRNEQNMNEFKTSMEDKCASEKESLKADMAT